MNGLGPASKPRDQAGLPQDSWTEVVVSALVGAGLVEEGRRSDATEVVDRVFTGEPPMTASLRRRVSEVAGYVGGAFVVAAAVLFFQSQWVAFSPGARVGILTAITGLLALAAVLLIATDGGFAGLRTAPEAVRRRLAGVLFTGAAFTGAVAVGIHVNGMVAEGGSGAMMAAGMTGLALALVGYLLAPTVLGQVAVAVAFLVGTPAALAVMGAEDPLPYGLVVLAVGVLWLVLVEREVWYEMYSARVVGCFLVVLGAQIPVASAHAWVGYLATLAAAGAGFALYVYRRFWPYLATGVVGLTLVTPEALTDWTEGSLGTATILLLAGVTLLVTSLLGLRLRKRRTEPA